MIQRENQIDLFIRMLFEALELDRLHRKLGLRVESSGNAKKHNRILQQLMPTANENIIPLDCVELMTDMRTPRTLVI